MSIVTITLNNRKFGLSCPPEKQDELFSIAGELDVEIEKIRKNNPQASFELSMVILALQLQSIKNMKWSENSNEMVSILTKDFQDTLNSIESDLKAVAEKLI
jgi:cell division protein ZapA (FtsZ GTPase activity inhibitor)